MYKKIISAILTLMTTAAVYGMSLTTYKAISNPPVVVTLAWDPSTSPSITNYSVYYGNAGRTYTNKLSVGTNTTTTLSLPRGGTYYVAVTATDTNNLESDFSNEITDTVPAIPTSPILHNAQ